MERTQNETLVPGIVAELRDRILNGRLRPGEPLHQVAIAKTLGVSMIPLREALRTMEADGLVEFTPHKGVKVAEVTSLEVLEWSLEVKAMVGILFPNVIPRLDAETFTRLHALATRKPTTLPILQEFFREVCVPCGMPRLLRRLEHLMTRFGRYLPAGGDAVLMGLRENPPTLEDLLRSLEARDPEAVLKGFDAYMMPWVEAFRSKLESAV